MPPAASLGFGTGLVNQGNYSSTYGSGLPPRPLFSASDLCNQITPHPLCFEKAGKVSRSFSALAVSSPARRTTRNIRRSDGRRNSSRPSRARRGQCKSKSAAACAVRANVRTGRRREGSGASMHRILCQGAESKSCRLCASRRTPRCWRWSPRC
jgi:hypothetical protein